MRRTEVSPFGQKKLYSLEELSQLKEENALADTLLPIDIALENWPTVTLNEAQSQQFFHGQKIILTAFANEAQLAHKPLINSRIYTHDGRFLGLSTIEKNHTNGFLMPPKRLFNL